MGSVITEIQPEPTFPRHTGRMVKFTVSTTDQPIEVLNTVDIRVAHEGDYIIDADELGFDVMTPEVFAENYEVKDFDELSQVGTAELLDSGYPI